MSTPVVPAAVHRAARVVRLYKALLEQPGGVFLDDLEAYSHVNVGAMQGDLHALGMAGLQVEVVATPEDGLHARLDRPVAKVLPLRRVK